MAMTGQWVDLTSNSGATPMFGGTSSTIDPNLLSDYASFMGKFPSSAITGFAGAIDPSINIANSSNFNSGLMNLGTGANPFGQQYNSNDAWSNAAYNTALGNQAGASYATQANRVNQVTPYGSLNYNQSVDQYGNPTWTATQSLSPELQKLTQSSLAGLQQSQANPMYGINPGETYTDALMRRLQPTLQNQQESFDVKMANQGIPVGSEAYNRAARVFQQGQNDQLTSAQIGGMQTGLQAQQLQNQTASNIKSLASPGYVNPYTQAAVAGPDYLGAAGLSNQNAIANQNMQNASSANFQNGLFGLAGTGMMAYALS